MMFETDSDMTFALPAGTLVDGRYEIVRQIGQGGFAVVYLARHVSLGREVALKILDLTGNQRDVAMFRTRFQREAQLASQIDHPHVVRIHDFGFVSQNQQPYMAMELLEGHDLEEELLRFGPLAPARALRLFDGALDGLGSAHEKNIIHKDLKPSNLFIAHPGTDQERMVVLDFGIAHMFDDPGSRLTQTNQYTGTPAYAAPEYIDTQVVSPALDVYQMGLIIGESLSGTPVVEASSPMAFLIAHCNGQQRIDERLLHTPIASVLKRAVAVDPATRQANAGELRESLLKVTAASIPDLSGAGYVSTRHYSVPPIAHAVTLDSVPQEPRMMMPVATQPGHASSNHVWPLVIGAISVLCVLLVLPCVGLVAYLMISSDVPDDVKTTTSQVEVSSTSTQSKELVELQRALDDSVNPEEWRTLYTKFAQINQAKRFLLPIFNLSIVIYLEQRRLNPNDLERVSQLSPPDFRMLFESAYTQVMQAQHSTIEQEALDSALVNWRNQAEKMQPILNDLYTYWQDDKLWKKDGGEAGNAIDRRLKRHLEEYQQKYAVLNDTMQKQERTVLTYRKKQLGSKDLSAEVEVIDAILALQTLHNEISHDPESSAARTARVKYQDLFKIARRAAQRVEKTHEGGFVLPGANAHIDNMRAYNSYLEEFDRDLARDKPLTTLEHVGHINWLDTAYHDTLITYYNVTVQDRALRALQKFNAAKP